MEEMKEAFVRMALNRLEPNKIREGVCPSCGADLTNKCKRCSKYEAEGEYRVDGNTTYLCRTCVFYLKEYSHVVTKVVGR